MSDKEIKIPKSRGATLFKMAAKMAIKQGKQFISQNPDSKLKTLVEQADILVNDVGRLKGAAMKAVQTLSIEGHDFLPPEVLSVLEKLQSQSEPLPSQILISQMKEELGEERFNLLENISPKPVAAASIGQVYEATYQGQSVVLKIQYPGIAESVDSDINALKRLLKALVVVSQKRVDMDEVLEEARRVLKLETDYKHEEGSLQQYKKLFEGSDYIIPKVYPELTTPRVLVLSKEEGLEFGEWLKTSPPVELREKVAEQLLTLYIKEFFENQLVQTDPNPANFLVNKEGKLVLLDFGATVPFDMQFVEDYQRLLRSVFREEEDKILENIFALNFLDARESLEAQQGFVDFLLYSLTPFKPELQPFDFAGNEYSNEVRQRAFEFTRKLKYSAPPKQLIFLHRKLGGVFMLLKKLEVKSDLTSFRDLILTKDFY